MTEIKDDPLSPVERLYLAKPAACSSPVIHNIDGKDVRVHYGYYYGYNMLYRPTFYTTDVEEIKAYNELIENKKGVRL
jgi:hypothetical protein